MAADSLVPTKGCWVGRPDSRGVVREIGMVDGSRIGQRGIELRVQWKSGIEWVPLTELRCGLLPGFSVQDKPFSDVRPTLGSAQVVATRRLGGRDQVNVQLHDSGRSLWLPYENLVRLSDVGMKFDRLGTDADRPAERFRLKLFAHALESWNFLTGSLDRLDIDPLPHQIQLVHRILSSGNHNWLIADDVGLGKTIEVGLLLAALKRKGQARRTLIVAPAPLTRQWRDEMQDKFGETYRIFGRDFTIDEPEHWKLYEHVIVSLDLAKNDAHRACFEAADTWDVVVFDECHRLTRHANGERTDRYRLAEALRRRAETFLLLSGTPHQGYQHRFTGLLELVRPDLRPQIDTLTLNPEIVGEMILRNRKSAVTDLEGRLIFRGHDVHRVSVEPSSATRAFQAALHEYLTRGYRAGEAGGNTGRAIGFVMVVFRKLASSSIAAIERALQRRLERLDGVAASPEAGHATGDMEMVEGGDDQDDLDERVGASSFFWDERTLLHQLLAAALPIRANDEKLALFLDRIAEPVFAEGHKLLVFTEYRATQDYLRKALENRFSGVAVAMINGSQDLDTKRASIAAFAGDARFLISTEAGGEGINLQDACHILVNYDLPWNPARLVQRIGRLYRYGQRERVVVFNLHAKDTFDNAAIGQMLDRVDTIAREMASIGPEFDKRLYTEILGDLLENLDMGNVLQLSRAARPDQSPAEIDAAIREAERARRLHEEIFAHAPGFDPNALSETVRLTLDDLGRFTEAMLPFIGASLRERTHDGRVLDIRLPEELRNVFRDFGRATSIRLTTDRRIARRNAGVAMLDLEQGFVRFLISKAKSYEFGGHYTAIKASQAEAGTFAAYRLRWQNDQGEPLTEELLTLFRSFDGVTAVNPPAFARWLREPLTVGTPPSRTELRMKRLTTDLQQAAERRLGKASTRFKHPNALTLLVAADLEPTASDDFASVPR